MNSKRFLLAMMAVAVLMGSSLAALSERDEEAELHTDAEVSCEDINDTHEFEGDCCSLFDAPDGGCFLNVTNGYCIVSDMSNDVKAKLAFTALETKGTKQRDGRDEGEVAPRCCIPSKDDCKEEWPKAKAATLRCPPRAIHRTMSQTCLHYAKKQKDDAIRRQ